MSILDSSKIIVKCIAGSNLYGTARSNSDIDTRGVFIPPREFYMGFLDNTETMEDKKEDKVFHELRKFMTLACNANPNIIELLFVPQEWILEFSWEWQVILKNRHLFLSTKAKHAFSGYAHAQLMRIKRHRGWLFNPPKEKPMREKFGIPEHQTIGKDQIGAFNHIILSNLNRVRDFHPLREQILEMEETIRFEAMVNQVYPVGALNKFIPVSENLIELIQREKSYQNAMNEWNNYQSWKINRNPARAGLEAKHGYDTKHAMNLVRLLLEGEELLKTGEIKFPRPEAKFLLEVYEGLLKYDELCEFSEERMNKLNELYKTSKLPREPKRKEANSMCIALIKDHIK